MSFHDATVIEFPVEAEVQPSRPKELNNLQELTLEVGPLHPRSLTAGTTQNGGFFPSSNNFGVFSHSSPTAIALGSSAIVKVSGQNCFRALYGSLGQIRLGVLGRQKVPRKVPPRFRQGSTKVSPNQGCAGFMISLVFWGRSVLGCQKVLWKVPPSLL